MGKTKTKRAFYLGLSDEEEKPRRYNRTVRRVKPEESPEIWGICNRRAEFLYMLPYLFEYAGKIADERGYRGNKRTELLHHLAKYPKAPKGQYLSQKRSYIKVNGRKIGGLVTRIFENNHEIPDMGKVFLFCIERGKESYVQCNEIGRGRIFEDRGKDDHTALRRIEMQIGIYLKAESSKQKSKKPTKQKVKAPLEIVTKREKLLALREKK